MSKERSFYRINKYIMEIVKELLYYKKSDDEGCFLLKIENKDSSGYWAPVNMEELDKDFYSAEKVKEWCTTLNQITYTGNSNAKFLKEFDYLPSDSYLIEIDGVIHCIHAKSAALKTLGKVQVEQVSLKDSFKAISKESECLYHIDGYHDINRIGPFFKIEQAKLDEKFPNCFFGMNENNEIVRIFGEKIKSPISEKNDFEYNIFLKRPVKEVKLIQINDGSIANWKLTYADGTTQILLYSITNASSLCIFLNLSDYI